MTISQIEFLNFPHLQTTNPIFAHMLYETLIKATEAGAAVLQDFFEGKFYISHKEGKNNLVTEADLAAEKAIIEVIKKEFPDHQVLCEEGGETKTDSGYKWIIDPIDGTVNFAHSIPLCCVSIGLEKDGEMIMGAVYNPVMNEFYTAKKGEGAFLNDKKITVSAKEDFLKCILVTGFAYVYPEGKKNPLQLLEKLLRLGLPIRRLGSAALDLCWVAAGRFDGFYEHGLQPWDSAAGVLIVEEAGGKVTHFAGEKFSPYKAGIVATNGKIHDALVTVIAED